MWISTEFTIGAQKFLLRKYSNTKGERERGPLQCTTPASWRPPLHISSFSPPWLVREVKKITWEAKKTSVQAMIFAFPFEQASSSGEARTDSPTWEFLAAASWPSEPRQHPPMWAHNQGSRVERIKPSHFTDADSGTQWDGATCPDACSELLSPSSLSVRWSNLPRCMPWAYESL